MQSLLRIQEGGGGVGVAVLCKLRMVLDSHVFSNTGHGKRQGSKMEVGKERERDTVFFFFWLCQSAVTTFVVVKVVLVVLPWYDNCMFAARVMWNDRQWYCFIFYFFDGVLLHVLLLLLLFFFLFLWRDFVTACAANVARYFVLFFFLLFFPEPCETRARDIPVESPSLPSPQSTLKKPVHPANNKGENNKAPNRE